MTDTLDTDEISTRLSNILKNEGMFGGGIDAELNRICAKTKIFWYGAPNLGKMTMKELENLVGRYNRSLKDYSEDRACYDYYKRQKEN